MTLSSAAVTVISRPSGAAPCETHGNSSTPFRHTPTAPSSTTRPSANRTASPIGERALERPPSTGTPGAASAMPSSTASVGNE